MGRKKKTTKQKIVDAAWKLFYTKGYDDTTIEDIIKGSRTSKGSFYHYFKGKDALLGSLSDLFDQQYIEIMEEDDSNKSASDRLYEANQRVFRLIEEQVDIHLLAYMYSSQLVTEGDRHLLNREREYFKYITQVLKEGLDSGEFYHGFTLNQLVKIYAMFERSMLYDWSLCKGTYSLTTISSYLLNFILERFRKGFIGDDLPENVKQSFLDAYLSQ